MPEKNKESKCEKCGFWDIDKRCCTLEDFELPEYCPSLYENDEPTYKGL